MFMFPEPPPLDYRITDVSRSYLSDGIFYYGKAAASHKYIAKQLKPIKRTLRDPLAPLQQLDARTLNRMLENEKGRYVDPPGKDDGVVYDTLSLIPKWKRDRKEAQKSIFSTFPRSQQYELSFVRDRRSKDFAKRKPIIVECTKNREETVKTDDEACDFLGPPVWWKGETGKPSDLPVGNINDYAYERPKELNQHDVKISEKLHMDHPRKYIPGAVHRIRNPEDTSMKDVLERADAFKVVLRKDETLPNDDPPVCTCICPCKKRVRASTRRDTKLEQDPRTIDAAAFDSRWVPLCEDTDFSGSDLERQEELRKLTRLFKHDLHTWYSKNKPTKLRLPIRYTGKRPIPERRFSHF